MQASDQAQRDVWIDLVRVASVAIVVIGHWVTTTVIWEDDQIGIENALSVVRGSHIATWLIQVMPLLFFIGGFSNYRSLERHERAYLSFLRTRLSRLLGPTLVFIGVWTAVGVAGQLSGLDLPNIVDRAADLAALPFWFLGLYVFVIALTPPMLSLHRRFGWVAPVAMAAGAAAVDVVHHGFGVPHVGAINFALVWLLAHQLGFFHADGSLLRLSRRVVAAATAGGLAALVLVTAMADYPVSMVGVPGDERWNTNPPSFALVALTCWLIGLAVLGRNPLLSITRRWRAGIRRANSRVLTVYVWHVSALAIAAVVAYPLGMPRTETGTAGWWAQRPVWILAAGVVLVILVWLLGRFEVHPAPGGLVHSVGSAGGAAAIGVLLTGFSILGFGVTGFNRPTHALGEDLLGIELNPLLNLVHLGAGLLLLYAMYSRSARWRATLGLLSAAFVALGWLGRDGVEMLGSNAATAVVHVVIGGLGLATVVWSVAEARR